MWTVHVDVRSNTAFQKPLICSHNGLLAFVFFLAAGICSRAATGAVVGFIVTLGKKKSVEWRGVGGLVAG